MSVLDSAFVCLSRSMSCASRFLGQVFFAGVVVAAFSGGVGAQGIEGSKHDLSSGGGVNGEICVYCHTPHGANITDPNGNTVAAPLWNRVFTTDPTTYDTYADLGSSTLDGSETTVGSVSIACLSCHDGTQATNVVINAPGSGNYNPSGASVGSGGLIPDTVARLGTDLRNDHPISIQYAGGGFTATTTPTDASQLGDPDFVLASTATIGGGPAWWVDTDVGTANQRDKTDMILYARTDTALGTEVQPFVECGSCHDPHNDTNGTFLRISNTGSAVCLSCHVK